ncbi:thiaminase II [Shimia ponticola]|uniref:thiaminase II n=1 Tax=Shimia ponticola TaxID=2582893 RepID=UPI00164C2102|nr:thiaminase II [Shimia ponticola]
MYGSAFTNWRDGSETWSAYTDHAFVRGLGDGSLPREAFLHYLRQDYVFLIHFSRAWALAVTKSDTLAEMQAAAGTVDGLVNHEMALHVETCAAVGISQAELEATVERPENMAYTRFVLEAGYSGDLLDLLAALAPCVLGYGEIGARLGQTATSDTYKDWIGTYSGDEYQEVCTSVGKLIDNALTDRLGADYMSLPRWQSLTHTFEKATVLEVGFWDMGLTP